MSARVEVTTRWGKWSGDPLCPHCGGEVTDSPTEDLAIDGVTMIECGACYMPVLVEGRMTVAFRVAAGGEGGES